MNIFKLSIIGIIICVTTGCKSKYVYFLVGNALENDTVKVECIYKKPLLPPDSSVTYQHIEIYPQLQQFPDYRSKNKNGVPTKFLETASICIPDYKFEIVFKGNSMTFIVPPYGLSFVEITRNNIDSIAGMIDKITVSTKRDSTTFSTPEAVNGILKDSEYKGDILIKIDSEMFTGKPKP